MERTTETTKKMMRGENFLGWVERAHSEGQYDFSELLKFVNAQQEKKPLNAYRWWKKVEGNEQGQGRLPRTMKHPVTGTPFVFPIVVVGYDENNVVHGTVVNPTCKKCGGDMERRTRRRDGVDFFGCKGYPTCRGACNAWTKVTDGERITPPVAKKPDPAPAKPVPTGHEALKLRILEIILKARKVVADHNITLPIGYRTTEHIAKLAITVGSADEAWRLWIDGRVSTQERAKFDAAGLPSGTFNQATSPDAEPSWYHTCAKVLDAGLPVMLVGPAGTGKTRFAKWYAAQQQKTLRMVVGSGDVAGRELWIARRDASGGTTTNIPGPAALAAAEGDVLLLDEVDGFDANALLPMNAILNGEREVSVPVLGVVEVHEDMQIIAAANTNGRSKDRTYAGRSRLDGAFLNRFAVVILTRYEAAIDSVVADAAILAALARAAK